MPRLSEHILDFTNLRLAWEEVAENKGAPGVDDISLKRWRRNWEERLVKLRSEVKANTYQPRPLRRFTVPKKDGSLREISILTVTDRVLQRAVLRVIDDIFDRKFLDCSYGYRAGRGLREAIPAILEHRDAGRRWVLDADIDNCFNSFDHALLMEFIRQEITDASVLILIEKWLKSGRREPDKPIGIPLGAVLSPLFCNIYLHRLDEFLTQQGYHLVRYADDFCVFCLTRKEALAAWKDTTRILERLHLRLETAKTNLTHFEQGFDYLGIHFYRDTYTFITQDKRVEVRGAFDPFLFYDYVPDRYQG